MKYRADIDGLRALAVIPVILFHAHVPFFQGGFIGVDIFFVISGYLITTIIGNEIRDGQFSVLKFYERRIRRIFPALFVVVFVSSVVAYWIYMPRDFQDYSQSVIATTLFASNILFWRESGYFEGPAEMKPLLHTWSLSVEEQFYIVLPLLLLLLHRWAKRHTVAYISVFAVLSFALSVWGVSHTPVATFYLTPMRAWELLIGSLLALGAIPEIRTRAVREGVGLLGVAFIGWCLLSYSKTTPFPGVSALLPCLGAACILHSGKGGLSVVSRLLSRPPVVFIGLISYSLYLWHWPVIVFFRYWNLYELTALQTVIAIVLPVVLAIVSWKFIEQPFRTRFQYQERKRIFGAAGLVMSAALLFGVVGYWSDGWVFRFNRDVRHFVSFTESRNPRMNECQGSLTHWIDPARACTYGKPVTPRWALWGDSHAGMIAEALGNIATNHGQAMKYFGYDACPPVIGIRRFDNGIDIKCLEYNASVLDWIVRSQDVTHVVLMARHTVYIEGMTKDFGPFEAGDYSPIFTDASGTVKTDSARRNLYTTQFLNTIQTLLKAGKQVTLIYPVPETGYHIPATLARLSLRGSDPAGFTRPFAYYETRNKFIYDLFDRLESSSRILRIYPSKKLCDKERCIVSANGIPLYSDDDHLSREGAQYVASVFEPIFAQQSARLE